MTPPSLLSVPVERLSASAVDAVPPHAGPIRWFCVGQAGIAAGLSLREGAVLMVGGHAHVGDTVVLVPALRGAPRLGRITRQGLTGDRDEWCDASRWRVAGRVLGVIASGLCPAAAAEVAPVRARQLPLFPARAA